jgi:hypothetical protein
MYFDYLVDNPSNPNLFLINCKVSLKYVEIQMGYLRMMIGNTPIVLQDKRGIKICKLELPKEVRFLTRDSMIAEKDYLQIPIAENYVNHQYFIHES